MNQKTDTKFKFSIPDLPRTGQQQRSVPRLIQKHNQIYACNGAVLCRISPFKIPYGQKYMAFHGEILKS